jgi:2-methylcitrate dehydratase PrpD
MLTERLAKFVCDTRDIPAAVEDAAKVALIDTLGVALAGTMEPVAQMTSDYVEDLAAAPKAPVWGRAFGSSAGDAAFANAVAGHALDFDDTLAPLRGHPSVTIIPVALAVGGVAGASGKDILVAYALGSEVAGKLGKAAGHGHYLRGWHSTATIGVFAATAVACRLLGLDAAGLRRAWGIAAAQSAGLVRNFGTMTKPFQAGHAARCAVTAASLAQRGVTADDQIFDNAHNFLATYAADGMKLEAALEQLGNPWEIVEPGINFKRWPCCYCNHRALGGLFEMLNEHNIRTDEIERVRVGFPPGSDEPLIYDEPKTGLEGKFSIQYSIAAAVLDRKLSFDTFTDPQVNRPAVRQIMAKVQRYRVADDKVYSGTIGYTDIEIVTNRGSFSRRVDKGPGSPAWPMSVEEHKEKFMDCSQRVLGEAAAHDLFDMAMTCESLPDINALVQALVPGARPIPRVTQRSRRETIAT